VNPSSPDESVNTDSDADRAETPRSLDETMLLGGDATPASTSGLHRSPEQWVGRRLGKYEITALLGVGGMGVVLKARDPSIERDVAIKVLPAELSANKNALNRFLAEAKSAGKLSHPNAVTIYEVASEGAVHYLVMEVVSGGSAAEYLEQTGAYSVSDATQLTIEACRGLAAAHKQGLVHRDVKPANLLLTDDGTAKVADFGLAKRAENQSMMMTQAGHLVGTPYYMSPEQCEAEQVDARSDVYSLGATYYSLLTGRCPFQDSASVVQVMFAHCNAGPPDPREVRATVPAACSAIIQRAMATKPDDRYQSMDEMRCDLEAILAAMSGAGIQLPSQSSATLVQPMTAAIAKSRRSFTGSLFAGAGLLALAGAGAAYFLSDGWRGGGLTDPNASKSTQDAIAVAPPSGEPIRIGILHSLTGTMGHSGTSVADATLLAVEELNRNGGILGRPVEAVVADGRSDPARFAREAERLIKEEDVCTVFGCWTSASRKTVVPVFEELDHLLVYPLQYEGIEESPNVIYTGASPNQQIIPAVKWAYAFENKRRFFLVGSDYVFPRVAHAIIKDQLKELGAELVGEAFLPLGSSEFQPVVEQIIAAKPDVILNSINGDSNLAFFSELRASGITPETTPTISFSVEEEELRQLDAAAMSGDYAAWNYFQSIDSEENKKFVASFRKKYGPQRVVTDPMESSYFGVKLWAQAVAEVAATDVRQIRRAMLNQRMRSPGGEVRIDPATQHTFKTPRIGQVKSDGQFEVVWTAAKPEPPMPYPSSRSAEEWRAFLHDLYTGWGNRWSAPNE
jgi:urea transport system substrate-binding protein